MIANEKFYTIIFSNFDISMLGLYKITFECEYQLSISEIPPEGNKMHLTTIPGEWDGNWSGGSQNFGAYDKNPIFVVNLKQNMEIMTRIAILEETKFNGESIIDFKSMQYSANLSIFPFNCQFPPKKGSLNLKSLKKPILSTHDGNYSCNQSSLVTERVFK